jgi:hypothetical protein
MKNYHNMRMEDKKFANILRMNKNSEYLLFGQSKVSNTSTLSCFGCVSQKQSNNLCKNIIYHF